jgi:site-specific DNA-methyltransferase (adenine-specific)
MLARPETFLDDRVTLRCGDCMEIIKSIPGDSVDSAATDPPYHLTSIVKRFGALNAAPAKAGKTGAYKRASAGFMGKQWDGGDIAFRAELWAEVLRVLKPGAHLVAFSGTRTYHRMACAIEDAGFEIRDQIGWTYGSGFPKSHNQKGDWEGWGTALKPAWEPICLARKPLIGTVAENLIEHETGALNIDGCRIHSDDAKGYEYTVKRTMPGAGQNKTGERKQEGVEFTGKTKDGRWPANIIHDGSDDVLEQFPETTSGTYAASHSDGGKDTGILGAMSGRERDRDFIGSTGSAARFFYTAKADADDRLGSKHPTVKPLDLMQWLVRLVTPPGGTVLDPFAGTGTTGEAAWREGFRAILIEREPEYQADMRRRMAHVLAGPEERQRTIIKASGKLADAGPLFGGAA